MDSAASSRLAEGILPWVAGRKLISQGSVPEAIAGLCSDFSDDQSDKQVVVAWQVVAPLDPGVLGVFVMNGKAEPPEGATPIIVQYLFADREGVTLATAKPDVAGFVQDKAPVYWLDAEPGKDPIATLIVAVG